MEVDVRGTILIELLLMVGLLVLLRSACSSCLLCLSLHHVGGILEHWVRHVELAFLVDVVGLATIADIDVPQA